MLFQAMLMASVKSFPSIKCHQNQSQSMYFSEGTHRHQTPGLHADCASHNIANKSKSYFSVTIWLAMPVTENNIMFGPLSI